MTDAEKIELLSAALSCYVSQREVTDWGRKQDRDVGYIARMALLEVGGYDEHVLLAQEYVDLVDTNGRIDRMFLLQDVFAAQRNMVFGIFSKLRIKL